MDKVHKEELLVVAAVGVAGSRNFLEEVDEAQIAVGVVQITKPKLMKLKWTTMQR